MLKLGQWHNKFYYPQDDNQSAGTRKVKNDNAAFQ